MHEKHFGLTVSPFSIAHHSRYLYMNEHRCEATVHLQCVPGAGERPSGSDGADTQSHSECRPHEPFFGDRAVRKYARKARHVEAVLSPDHHDASPCARNAINAALKGARAPRLRLDDFRRVD